MSIKGIKPFTSWCVEHAQYLLIAVCVAMTITETLFFPPAGVVTFFLVCVHVLAIILISRQPIVCCNIIFLLLQYAVSFRMMAAPAFYGELGWL